MRDDKKKSGIGVFGNPTFASFLREQIGKSALRPQTYWLRSLDGEIKLNFIGRFENLRNDFEKACQSMNVGNIELPHEIRSGDENYVSFYDTESANLIYNAYKEEIDLFGYNFES